MAWIKQQAPATVQRVDYDRGIFGRVFKIAFIAFNSLMAVLLFVSWRSADWPAGSEHSTAVLLGHAIGVALVSGTLLFVWGAGAVILGLLTYVTRGPAIISEVPRSRLPYTASVAIALIAAAAWVVFDKPAAVPAPQGNSGPPASAAPSILSRLKSPTENAQVIPQNTAPPVSTPAQLPEIGWNVREEKSKFDDSTNVYAALRSTNPVKKFFGSEGRVILNIRCVERVTALYFEFADHYMSRLNGRGVVTYRIDKKPAVKKEFVESSDNQALGLWSGAGAIPLIKEISEGSQLVVRAQPHINNEIVGEFDLAGAEGALKNLRASCRW